MVTIVLFWLLSVLLAAILGAVIAYRRLSGLVAGGFAAELEAARAKINQLRQELGEADTRATAAIRAKAATTKLVNDHEVAYAAYACGMLLKSRGKLPTMWEGSGGFVVIGYLEMGLPIPVYAAGRINGNVIVNENITKPTDAEVQYREWRVAELLAASVRRPQQSTYAPEEELAYS